MTQYKTARQAWLQILDENGNVVCDMEEQSVYVAPNWTVRIKSAPHPCEHSWVWTDDKTKKCLMCGEIRKQKDLED